MPPPSLPVHIQFFPETYHCCFLNLLRVSLALCFYPQPLKKNHLLLPSLPTASTTLHIEIFHPSLTILPCLPHCRCNFGEACTAGRVCPYLHLLLLSAPSSPPVPFLQLSSLPFNLSALCLLFFLPVGFPATMDLPRKQMRLS